MNRILQITLIVALVLSLSGNVVLAISSLNKTQQVITLTTKLDKTTNELSASEKNLQSAKDEITQKANRLSEMNDALASANTKLLKVKCSVTIPADIVQGASTNQALIDPITKAAESYYATNSVNTTFELVWNNTKTAIFTISWPDQLTSKILVSWGFDTNKIQAIFNVGDGCAYYLP